MSYLTLAEAAQYAHHKSGVELKPANLLRMGVLGHLLLVAYFDGLMRNLTTHENDEIAAHLTVAPRDLAKIENEGKATIGCAHSLDGAFAYSPQAERTYEQLRVLVSELDRIIPSLRTSQNQPEDVVDAAPCTPQLLDDDSRAEAEFQAGFDESVNNDKLISWRYWAEQMPSWTAAQAARLMCALDPDIFENLSSRPNKTDPSISTMKATQIQRLAEAEGVGSMAPADWLLWADARRLKVHVGLRLAVNALPPAPASAPLALNNYPDNDASIVIILRDAARRILPFTPELGLRWEVDAYATAHITDELREIWYRCAQKRNEQEIYTACEQVICDVWARAEAMEKIPQSYLVKMDAAPVPLSFLPSGHGAAQAEHDVAPATKAARHRLVNRTQPMATEIELAKQNAVNPKDATSIWTALTELAEAKTGSMIGFSSDGIQYKGKTYQASGEFDIFKFQNLRDRMGREKKRADA